MLGATIYALITARLLEMVLSNKDSSGTDSNDEGSHARSIHTSGPSSSASPSSSSYVSDIMQNLNFPFLHRSVLDDFLTETKRHQHKTFLLSSVAQVYNGGMKEGWMDVMSCDVF